MLKSLLVPIIAVGISCACLAQDDPEQRTIVLLDPSTPLYVPIPSGLVSLKSEVPAAFATKAASIDKGKQVLLDAFVQKDFAAVAAKGKVLPTGHEIDVLMPVGPSSGNVSDDQFDRFVARTRAKVGEQIVEHPKPVMLTEHGESALFAEEGSPEQLVDETNAYAFVLTHSLTRNGKTLIFKNVYGFLHVRGRFIAMSGSAMINKSEDLAWLKSNAISWINATLEFNAQQVSPDGAEKQPL